jgi:hypothetical protein
MRSDQNKTLLRLVIVALLALTGCTTIKSHYIETRILGDWEHKRVCFTRATTIGQGDTWGDIKDACGGTLQREEADTGFSDNAADVIEALPMLPWLP